MPAEDNPRTRLGDAMDQRRAHLRMQWNDVADKAEISVAHLRRVRNGTQALNPVLMAAIDDALQWQRGSVQAILDGGEPIPLKSTTSAPRPWTAGPGGASQEPWWANPPDDLPDDVIWDGLPDPAMQAWHLSGLDVEERRIVMRVVVGLINQRYANYADNTQHHKRRVNG